jgi:hypothetical protein
MIEGGLAVKQKERMEMLPISQHLAQCLFQRNCAHHSHVAYQKKRPMDRGSEG